MVSELRELIHGAKWAEAEAILVEHLEHPLPTPLANAQVLFYFSWLRRAQGRQLEDSAVIILRQLHSLHISENDYMISALYHFRQGDWFFCIGELDKAKNEFEKSINCFQSCKLIDDYELAYAQFHLALTYRDLFTFAAAIPLLLETLKITEGELLAGLRFKIYNELFFCYVFTNNSADAHICYEHLQRIKSDEISLIDVMIAESHLLILKKQFSKARKTLLSAYKLVKQHALSKNRYDLGFHVAYLYAKQKKFKKALLFLTAKSDPIYRLQILELQLRSGDKSIQKEYQQLALQVMSQHHLEQISRIKNDNSKIAHLKVDWHTLRQHERVAPLLDLLLLRGFATKESIARDIFADSFYEPHNHDPKIYRLIQTINGLSEKSDLIANHSGRYVFNPGANINFDEYPIAQGVALNEIVHAEVVKADEASVSKLTKSLALPQSQITKAIKYLEQNRRLFKKA